MSWPLPKPRVSRTKAKDEGAPFRRLLAPAGTLTEGPELPPFADEGDRNIDPFAAGKMLVCY